MASISLPGNNYAIEVDNNRGPKDTHRPLERPEIPPNPLSTVPFMRDPDFVSRSTLLRWIQEKSLVPGSRIALVGLGGVGKSHLAIEYSYRAQSESPTIYVFWVYASSEARFEQSFRDIADRLKIPGRQDPKVNIFKLVENRLRDEEIGKWVCIFDNVDDAQFLCSFPVAAKQDPTKGLPDASPKPLLEYVPKCRNGFIIITSRSREDALRMVGHKDLLEVTPMESKEALELLQRKLEQLGGGQESRQLVEELEFMPLAIVQAAGYIKHRTPRCSVSQYLEKLRNSDYDAIRLLDYEADNLYRDQEAKNSILVTWQISFDYIRQTRQSAADLLFLMSFFDRQGIPENLLRVRGERINERLSSKKIVNSSSDEDAGLTSETDTDDYFKDNVATLRDFAFISIGEDATVFTMHRLVQLTAYIWQKAHGQMERWKKKFISNLCQEFPTAEYENWERCRALFPHVKLVMSQRPESQESLQKWAALLYKGAWYALQSGNIADAMKMASKSRKQRVRMLGAESDEAVASTVILAKVFDLEGQWNEAEKLFSQVTETRIAKLGEDHADTLESIVNLASIYRKKGRPEAEKLFSQVIEACRAKLGKEHPDTLMCMANIASICRRKVRWTETEKLQMQVMETRRTTLGEDHPCTLSSMGNLAWTYQRRGRLEEAEKLQVQATLRRYTGARRWTEAEKLEVQVMETHKTTLGEDHPSTLKSMAIVASMYRDQGRREEAEKLEVQVMETRKTKLGKDHFDTLTSMDNLAVTLSKQDRWNEAEKLLMQVMETRKTKLGEDHFDTLTSMDNLAVTLSKQGRGNEAEKLLMQVMETRKTKLGENHPDTLKSMAILASTYRSQGRREEANKLEAPKVGTSNTTVAEDHPSTVGGATNFSFNWKVLWTKYQRRK